MSFQAVAGQLQWEGCLVLQGSCRTLRVSLAAIAAAVMVIGVGAENPKLFKPDGVFKGSTLTGWHTLGAADWRAENGVLIGRAKAGADGGWLVMDRGLQDLMLYANVRCDGACQAGVLMRAEKSADGGLRGVYVSLSDGDIHSYVVTLDAQGKETGREPIVAAARGGGGGGRAGRAGGGAGAAAAAPGGAAAGGAAAGGAPAGAGGGRAARAGGGGGRGRGAAAITALNPNDWNPIDILLAGDTLRATPGGGGALGEHAPSFGMVALFAGGTSEVRFKDVSWKDLNSVVEPAEQVSPNFTMKHVSHFYYGWSAAAADFNKDGAPDIVSGPFYYLGPSFTERRLYRTDRVYNPATEVRAGHGELRRRFHRRRMARHPRVGDGPRPADGPVCQPARRAAEVGQVPGAAEDHDRARPDEGPRRRRQAGNHLRQLVARRLRLGASRPGQPDGRMDVASPRRAG